jgi:hypothetical protein
VNLFSASRGGLVPVSTACFIVRDADGPRARLRGYFEDEPGTASVTSGRTTAGVGAGGSPVADRHVPARERQPSGRKTLHGPPARLARLSYERKNLRWDGGDRLFLRKVDRLLATIEPEC